MSDKTWMIYGANGYTGTLIAIEAARRGMAPIVAGRSEKPVRELADRLKLPHRVFSLDDPAATRASLAACAAVLHCAGPFSATSRPMVDACLDAGAHYLDITGELEVFEAIFARGDEAKTRGVTLMPGVGFDVVPSDGLAAMLKERLPAARSLELAFDSKSPVSGGTAKTMIEALPHGGAIRRNGRIERTPMLAFRRKVAFADGTRWAMSIPWGDVSTAYHSLGFKDVTIYAGVPRAAIVAAPVIRALAPLLGRPGGVRALKKMVDRFGGRLPEKPGAGEKCELWARAEDADGRAIEGTLTTRGTYALTAKTAVESVRRMLEGGAPAGAVSPSQAFGADYVTTFSGCVVRIE
ncbi:saccharopine dehydrogenase NADP-binding domain-containing protein [bacterium]|nr:saccharopine dehydrogenase NADP-binding domain-containing protein [bacterium]